jgi:hypothetical protein
MRTHHRATANGQPQIDLPESTEDKIRIFVKYDDGQGLTFVVKNDYKDDHVCRSVLVIFVKGG